jgi:hypothetical protein
MLILETNCLHFFILHSLLDHTIDILQDSLKLQHNITKKIFCAFMNLFDFVASVGQFSNVELTLDKLLF